VQGNGEENDEHIDRQSRDFSAFAKATADRSDAGEPMNMLILNRESFKVPDDGWYQLAPMGEFAHGAAGVVQVVDAEACTAMAARFKADAAVANFAGLLVDFDHFSLDGERRTEAAGWIMGLEYRGQRDEGGNLRPEAGKTGAEFEQKVAKETKGDGPSSRAQSARCGAGLWANIRWSDVGEAAVKGGRYRFLSPVWARSDCVDLGNGRVRPVRLLNAAVTNDPNLKGMVALSNRSQESEFRSQKRDERGPSQGAPVDSCASIGRDEGGDLRAEAEKTKPQMNAGGRRCGEDGATGASQGTPVDSCACNRQGCGRADGGDLKPEFGNREKTMKRVIERLVNHLGLAGDATEDAILEKMQGLPGLTVVTDLQNSLKLAQDERDALQGKLKGAEDELVNRHLAEFEGVVTEKTKGFWTEQLLKNREAALAALGEIAAKGKEASGKRQEQPTPASGHPSDEGNTRKPLHNRATARPVIPGAGGGSPETDSRAVKIRNRAHEIAKGEGVAFSVAFRRAEKEVCEG